MAGYLILDQGMRIQFPLRLRGRGGAWSPRGTVNAENAGPNPVGPAKICGVEDEVAESSLFQSER